MLGDADALSLRRGLEAAGLEQERRALRLRPDELAGEWTADDVLVLRFALPPGTYATCVLEAIGDVAEPVRNGG